MKKFLLGAWCREGFFRGLFQRAFSEGCRGLGEREGGGEVGTRPCADIIKIHPCTPRGGGGREGLSQKGSQIGGCQIGAVK